MAWRQPGDKPLPEPMMVSLLTHICVTRPQWVKFSDDTNTLNKLALTHWSRVSHICVGKQTIIGSDNGLAPGGHKAITRTSALMLLIGSLRTNFSEILIRIQTFSFKKMHLKMLSVKWRPFCLLKYWILNPREYTWVKLESKYKHFY